MLGVESTLVSRRKVPNVSDDRQRPGSGWKRRQSVSPSNIVRDKRNDAEEESDVRDQESVSV